MVRKSIDLSPALIQSRKQTLAPAGRRVRRDALVSLLVGLREKHHRSILRCHELLHSNSEVDFLAILEFLNRKEMQASQFLARIALCVFPIVHNRLFPGRLASFSAEAVMLRSS